MAASSVWTPERIEYLVGAWSSDVSVDEVMNTLNAMSGDRFTNPQQLHDKARRIGVRRPDNIRSLHPGVRQTTLWTEERVAYFIPAWQAGRPREDIIATLSQMSGDGSFTNGKQLSEKARKLHIKRPEWYNDQQRRNNGFSPKYQEKAEVIKPPSRHIWTEERKEVFSPMWQNGASYDDIMAALNALDGRPFTNGGQLADQAKRLSIRRPEHHLRRVAVNARRVQIEAYRATQAANQPKARAKLPAPPKLSKSPIKVPLHVVYNQGFQLWQDGFLPVTKRDDLEAINKAIRKAEPGHPGFQLVTRWFGA